LGGVILEELNGKSVLLPQLIRLILLEKRRRKPEVRGGCLRRLVDLPDSPD
jgi:hypothetical protein